MWLCRAAYYSYRLFIAQQRICYAPISAILYQSLNRLTPLKQAVPAEIPARVPE